MITDMTNLSCRIGHSKLQMTSDPAVQDLMLEKLQDPAFAAVVGLVINGMWSPSLKKQPVEMKVFAKPEQQTDRDEVLGRIQGIQKILHDLDIFLDVAKLRSGDDWRTKLTQVIPENDIFYLFGLRQLNHPSGCKWNGDLP